MNIKEQKTEFNKKTSTKTSTRTSAEDKPSIQTKAPTTRAERPKCQTEKKYSSYDHYNNNNTNTARMPTHNPGQMEDKKMNNKTSNILSIKFIQKDLDRRLLSGVPNFFEVKTIEKFDQTGAKWQNAAIDFERVFVTFQRM
jgi:hypothetical protein